MAGIPGASPGRPIYILKMNLPEKPIYVLQQNKKRAIIPKILLLFVLGTIFYLGLLLNLRLLDLLGSEETTTKTVSLIILILIIILGVILTIVKANRSYIFYQNRIMFGKKQIFYQEISNTNLKINFIDKMFKTYSISLSKKFRLRNIPQELNLQSYLQQLVNYSKQL